MHEKSAERPSTGGYRNTILYFRLPKSGPILEQLVQLVPFSEARLHELFSLGSIYCNEKRVLGLEQSQVSAPAESLVRVHSEPRRCEVQSCNWQQRIVSENENFLLLDKPAGVPSHPMVDNWPENALVQLEKLKRQKLFLTHRLDRPTEGLLVIGKTASFQREFNLQLTSPETEKHYRAEVLRPLPADHPKILQHWMIRDPRGPKKILANPSSDPMVKTDECLLEIGKKKESTKLNLQLLTGRTHQIRAQLAFLESPITGDVLYGAPPLSNKEKIEDKIHLQAAHLQFIEPSTKQTFSFSLPEPPWF